MIAVLGLSPLSAPGRIQAVRDLVQPGQVQLVSLDKPLSFCGVVFPAWSPKTWFLQELYWVSRPPASSEPDSRGGT